MIWRCTICKAKNEESLVGSHAQCKGCNRIFSSNWLRQNAQIEPSKPIDPKTCDHPELLPRGFCAICGERVDVTGKEDRVLKFDFRPGDIVEYCGDQAEVVINYGDSGTVKQGKDFMRWFWVFENEPVRLVRRA